MGIDRAKEATKRLGLEDCCSVLRLRRYQRTAKINGYVSLRPSDHPVGALSSKFSLGSDDE